MLKKLKKQYEDVVSNKSSGESISDQQSLVVFNDILKRLGKNSQAPQSYLISNYMGLPALSVCQQLCSDLWESVEASKIVPIVINLHDYLENFKDVVQYTLKSAGLKEKDFENLRENYHCVFFIFNYKDVGRLCNLFIATDLSQWKNCSVITCCSGKFISTVVDKAVFFSPFSNEQRLKSHYQEYVLGSPFETVKKQKFLDSEKVDEKDEADNFLKQLEIHPLNQKRYVDDQLKLQFWVDVLRRGDAGSDVMRQFYKTFLRWAQKNPNLSVAVSNIMTILNLSRFSFSHYDLRFLDMQYANLDRMIGYGALLDGANLSFCSTRGAYLANASLKETTFDGLTCGEKPSYQWATGCVTKLRYSADGKSICVAGDDNTVVIYDKESGETLMTLRSHVHRVSDVVMTSDACYVISASAKDRVVNLYDMESQRSWRIYKPDFSGYMSYGAYFPIVLSKCEKFIIMPKQGFGGSHRIVKLGITGESVGVIEELDISGGNPVSQLDYIDEKHIGKVTGLGKDSYVIQIYDLKTSEEVQKFSGYRFCVSKNSHYFAIVHITKEEVDEISIYVLPEYKKVKKITAKFAPVNHSVTSFEGRIRDMVFVDAEEGLYLAAGGDDGTLFLWDVMKDGDAPVSVLVGHRKPITSIAVSPDGNELISGTGELSLRGSDTGDKLIRIWDVISILKSAQQQVTHTGRLEGLFYSSIRGCLISAGNDGVLRFWSVDTGEMNVALDIYPDAESVKDKEVQAFCCIEETEKEITFIVVNGRNKSSYLTVNNNFVFKHEPLDFDSDRKMRVFISGSKQYLVFCGLKGDKTPLRIYDNKTHKLLGQFEYAATKVCFSEDEEKLAFVSSQGCGVVWLPDCKMLLDPDDLPFNNDGGGLGAVVFSPEINTVVYAVNPYVKGKQYHQVYVVNYLKKEVVNKIEAHKNYISAMGVSPDQKYILTSDSSGQVIVWDPLKWRELSRFHSVASKSLVCQIEFLSNKEFIVGHIDGSFRRWSIGDVLEKNIEVSLDWYTHGALCLDNAVIDNAKKMSSDIKRLFKQKNAVFQGEDNEAIKSVELARVFLQLRQVNLAVECVKCAIELDPFCLQAYYLWGQVLIMCEKHLDAENVFTIGINKGLEKCRDFRALRALYISRGIIYLMYNDGSNDWGVRDFESAMGLNIPNPTKEDKRVVADLNEYLEKAKEAKRISELVYRCRYGKRYSFISLFKDGDEKFVDGHGLTLLHYAVSEGNEAACEFLLSNGADPCVGDDQYGNTVLLQAILVGKAKLSLLEMLMEKAPKVISMCNKNFMGPIHAAVKHRRHEVLRCLLRYGANPDAHTLGMAPAAIFTAIHLCDFESVQLLIESGANYKITTSLGNTPMLILTENAIKLLKFATLGRLTREIFSKIVALYKIGEILLGKYKEDGASNEELYEKAHATDLLKKIIDDLGSNDPSDEEIRMYNRQHAGLLKILQNNNNEEAGKYDDEDCCVM